MELFQTCVQNKRGLLFSFFIINQHCSPKMFYCENVCSDSQYCTPNVILRRMTLKQAPGCFLVYYAAFLMQKMCAQGMRELAF